MFDVAKTLCRGASFAPAQPRDRAVVTAILTLGLLLRIAAAYWLPNQSAALPDIVTYRESAAQLLANGLMISPFQMPLYPLLIALFGKWQIAADIAISTITIWLVYALALEMVGNRLAAIFAALACACYPPLIFFAVVGLSETLFIALLLTTFLFWYRGNFAAASLFAVLTILTRPIFDIAPLFIVYFSLVIHRQPLTQTLKHVIVYAVIYGVLLAPWWAHNYRRYGEFVRLTAGAGYTLYAGNNPLNTSGGGNIGVDFKIDDFAQFKNDAERDRAMGKAAHAYIVSHPARFFELAGLKFMRIWRLWPVNTAYASMRNIVISALTFIPVLLLSGLGLWLGRGRLRQLSPVLIFGLLYTMAYMVLVGTIRYRLPLEPFLLILAGLAASNIAARLFVSPASTGPSALPAPP
ncbi:MAG: hypothetical protein GC182_06995 [Rhodopseudomonas sp.]|nr:hypothetical protein [Rhodopseudomonas sp.]